MPSSSFLEDDAAKLALDNAVLTSVELSILRITWKKELDDLKICLTLLNDLCGTEKNNRW
jgi:hypothetical protein